MYKRHFRLTGVKCPKCQGAELTVVVNDKSHVVTCKDSACVWASASTFDVAVHDALCKLVEAIDPNLVSARKTVVVKSLKDTLVELKEAVEDA